MKPVLVDIFSGAGGSTLGFVWAGFKPIGALDNYKYAVETFCRYFRLDPVIEDARSFNFGKWARELGDVDVLVGCPPCQGFSRMKNPQRGGEPDPRNDLVYVYVQAVMHLRPLVVVFENVGWMVKAYKGRYFRELVDRLVKMGYSIVWRVVDAADYGVPQHRRRLILIGSLKSRPKFPKPTHGSPSDPEVKDGLKKPWRTVREAIADLPPLGPGERHPDVPNHETKKLPENWIRLIKAIPKNGGSRRDAPPELWLPCHRVHKGHHDVFGRLYWDRPSNTITTGCWDPSRGRFVHPEQDRGLSLRECARLQTFPDDFVFYGPPSSVAKQIGNALPPLLAEAIAKTLKKVFF